MKIYVINGSPRKKWNTGEILENILQGARAKDPEIECETVNLYDYAYKGCHSCFECKRIGGQSYGKCVIKDDIHDLLGQVLHADIAVFGSPIYFGNITGMMRSFMERLFFPIFVYDNNYSSLAPKKLVTAFIYTMNVPKSIMDEWHYPDHLKLMEDFAARVFGRPPHIQYVNNTWQFKDYSKYKADAFSVEDKKRQREEIFPKDCHTARILGEILVDEARG